MIGEVSGVAEGDVFANRQALHDAGVHAGLQGGIGGVGQSYCPADTQMIVMKAM